VLIAVRRAAERPPGEEAGKEAGGGVAVLPAPASPERTLAPAPGEEVVAERVLADARASEAGGRPPRHDGAPGRAAR
jgi:hypothetical protein